MTAVVLAKITAGCFGFCSLLLTGLIFFTAIFFAGTDVGGFLPGVFGGLTTNAGLIDFRQGTWRGIATVLSDTAVTLGGCCWIIDDGNERVF